MAGRFSSRRHAQAQSHDRGTVVQGLHDVGYDRLTGSPVRSRTVEAHVPLRFQLPLAAIIRLGANAMKQWRERGPHFAHRDVVVLAAGNGDELILNSLH